MKNILVDAPTGAQELIQIDASGGYFDPARIVWNEWADGALPAITLGGMVRSDGTLSFSQTRMDQHTAAIRPPIPQSVTRRQARQALLLAGLLDNVQPALDAITDATQRRLMQIEWDDSQEFHRQRPALLGLAAALGLNSAQIDQLFITAATL